MPFTGTAAVYVTARIAAGVWGIQKAVVILTERGDIYMASLATTRAVVTPPRSLG